MAGLPPGDDGVERVLAAWDQQLSGTPAGDVLRILGLFDRPAPDGALRAVAEEPGIAGLTEHLAGQPGALEAGIAELRELGLVERAHHEGHEGDSRAQELDCHPHVRDHWGALLLRAAPEAWREGNRRLFEWFQGQAEQRPDTVAEMEPLFRAVGHGVAAGEVGHAQYDLYFTRIGRGSEHYLTNKLGAFAANLALLGAFFEEPWASPDPRLPEPDQAWLLNKAGFALRALGRLADAVEPMRAGQRRSEEQEDWKGAAVDAGNLSELLLVLGRAEEAEQAARQAVEHADRSGDGFQRMGSRTTHANALARLGRQAEARALFEQAEAMQTESQPQYPLLYSLQGYLYCDLLLAAGEAEEVRRRATQTIRIAQRNGSLLAIALDHLSLARASTALGDAASAAIQFEAAVDGLRAAGQDHELPRGLLHHADFLLTHPTPASLAQARAHLDQADDLITRCGMALYAPQLARLRAELEARTR